MGLRIQAAESRALPRRMGSVVVDHPLPILVVAAIVLIGWYLIGTRSQPHHVRAAFPSALTLTKGLDVQVDGVDVGKVSSVDFVDGQAIVGLGITDDNWPLHQGTKATIRFGTTLGNATRFVELEPGPRSARELPEDGIIPTRDTTAPVEFDEMFNTFGDETRRDLKGMFRGTADTFDGRARELSTALRDTPPALEETAGLLQDLHTDEEALRGLVANGHRATRTLAARKPELADLMTVMAATFDEFGENARNVRASLDEFAPALRDSRQTLARLDITVDRLDGLARDVRPAARSLRPFVRDARPALSELATAAPLASSTFRTLRRTAPGITRLLREGKAFAPRLDGALAGLTPHIACVRPYAPDIAGMFTNWASWGKHYDKLTHYGRVKGVQSPSSYPDQPPQKTDEFLAGPGQGLRYAYPRPPGLETGKPFFLPECGAGPEALDPAKDPDDR